MRLKVKNNFVTYLIYDSQFFLSRRQIDTANDEALTQKYWES